MSDDPTDQLKDLRRLKAQWEDDPDQRTPFPLEELLAELEAAETSYGPKERPPAEPPG